MGSESWDDPRPFAMRVTPRDDACAGTPWTPDDMGSLDERRRFAWCTPFVVQAGVLAPTRLPHRSATPTAAHTVHRLLVIDAARRILHLVLDAGLPAAVVHVAVVPGPVAIDLVA